LFVHRVMCCGGQTGQKSITRCSQKLFLRENQNNWALDGYLCIVEKMALLQWNVTLCMQCLSDCLTVVSREHLIKFTSYFSHQISGRHFKWKSAHNSRATTAQRQDNYSEQPQQIQRNAKATPGQFKGNFRPTPAQRQGHSRATSEQLTKYSSEITVFRINLQRKLYALFCPTHLWVSQFQRYIAQNWANTPELTRRTNIS
jgi:hypothetical protein